MKRLITTTAAALAVAATGAIAAEHSGDDDMATTSDELMQMGSSELIRSRDLTGSAIYTLNEASDEGWDPETSYDAVDTDWNQIGEIEDLVLDKEGNLRGIVAEVGGFIDIADKHVMISVDDLNLVASDSYTYVTRMSEEDLESMQGIDEAYWN